MNRGGYSLLEILIAITILATGMVGLSMLTEAGQTRSLLSRELSLAQLACQTRINEILAGSVPLQTINDEPIPALRGWTLSVALDPNQKQGILAVWVTAQRQQNQNMDSRLRRAGRFRIVQWMNVNTPPNPVSISRPQDRSSYLNPITDSSRAGTLDSLFSSRPSLQQPLPPQPLSESSLSSSSLQEQPSDGMLAPLPLPSQ